LSFAIRPASAEIEPNEKGKPSGQEETGFVAKALNIAIIGYGEVGRIFSRELIAAGASVSAYDILINDPARAPGLIAHADAARVMLCTSAAEAARGADIVISAVTASEVGAVAAEAAGYLRPGQVFLDVNSASPSTKRAAARTVEACGAHYVEGAVMAPVGGVGLKVPILAGGQAAAATAERLNALGMTLRPVAEEHGRASAMKLCRSIMIKGIEALIVDCAAAAKRWDVEAEVFGSLDKSFPGTDFAALAAYMAERVHTHGRRRAAEMREAAAMLADLGLAPDLAEAVADAQDRGAATARCGPPQP
jgi:3-hydroxyisobutyrate dehydrogenase-like beta-hydroxyacid dehydrogenase